MLVRRLRPTPTAVTVVDIATGHALAPPAGLGGNARYVVEPRSPSGPLRVVNVNNQLRRRSPPRS
jgi:hypothetical protein